MPRRRPRVRSVLLTAPGQGAETFLFPELQRSAQSAALGGGAAFLQGVSALGVNPAGLRTARTEIQTQYNQLLAQSSLASLSFGRPFGVDPA